MAEIGIFAPDERVELIDGIVYKMQPISPKHAYTVKRLSDSLSDCAGENAVTLTQSPLQIGNDNEPQPDLLIVKPPLERYAERHPRPEDVLLVIEVAHATLQSDRTLKLQLYASAGTPEYWIVNLHKPQLEIHRDPDTDEARYREVHTLAEGEVAEPLGLEGCEVAWWR
jgi:Uma2 family endonuclease